MNAPAAGEIPSPSGLGCPGCGTKRAPAWRPAAVELPDPSGRIVVFDVCDDPPGVTAQDGRCCASLLPSNGDAGMWFDRLIGRFFSARGVRLVPHGLARAIDWWQMISWVPYSEAPLTWFWFLTLAIPEEGRWQGFTYAQMLDAEIVERFPWCLSLSDPRWRPKDWDDADMEWPR